jgi:DNA primase
MTDATTTLTNAGNVSPEVLNASGLASQSEANDGGLYDRFRYRIMVPIQNEGGTVIGFAGRALREAPNTPKYLNSPETELFHKGHELYGLHLAKRAIRRSLTAVVVEGYFDVLSLHQAGDERAVAPMGTAMTAAQLRRLFGHANHVVFAFDGDHAGRRAALNAAAVFLREMKDSSTAAILVLPENEDPDSYVRKQGGPAWMSAIASAKPLSEFLCDVLREELDTTLPESQVRAAEKANRFLGEIRHANIFKRALQKKFEDVIGISIGQPEAPAERMEDTCPRPMR